MKMTMCQLCHQLISTVFIIQMRPDHWSALTSAHLMIAGVGDITDGRFFVEILVLRDIPDLSIYQILTEVAWSFPKGNSSFRGEYILLSNEKENMNLFFIDSPYTRYWGGPNDYQQIPVKLGGGNDGVIIKNLTSGMRIDRYGYADKYPNEAAGKCYRKDCDFHHGYAARKNGKTAKPDDFIIDDWTVAKDALIKSPNIVNENPYPAKRFLPPVIDECQSSPCQNGGVCHDGIDSFNCSCAQGYTSVFCETDIDECQSLPCQNEGVCRDAVTAFNCSCAQGYTGVFCETDINDCQSSPCQNGGVCHDGIDSFNCSCAQGYTGVFCESDISECASVPCQNGGSCTDMVNAYTCTCQQGYSGLQCETDIDDCAHSPCMNGGNCSDGVNGYLCACQLGFTGKNCETYVSICVSGPCMNNGSCSGGISNYTCACPPGFTGARCETEINECDSSPCENGGNCSGHVNMYLCECRLGYTGLNCETDIDDCVSSPCQHNGSCVDRISGYQCLCGEGFFGMTCENEYQEQVASTVVEAEGARIIGGAFMTACGLLLLLMVYTDFEKLSADSRQGMRHCTSAVRHLSQDTFR